MELKNGDCLELLKDIKSESISLLLTDPPYGEGIGKMGFTKYDGNVRTGVAKAGNYKGQGGWDSARPSKQILNEMFRISKNQIIFGGNFMADLLPSSRCWIVWDKRGSDRYRNDFADCELIWTSFDKPSRIIRHLWSGMLQEDMAHKEPRIHPTQKPLKLIKLLIKMFTEEGDTICDPFMGSGTTGVACKQLSREFIGCEINPTYFGIAEKRIGEATNQIKLGSLRAVNGLGISPSPIVFNERGAVGAPSVEDE